MLTRRSILKSALVLPVAPNLLAGSANTKTHDSANRRGQDGTARVDEAVAALMKKHELPGLGLAVMSRGRIVYTKGYGLADAEQNTPFKPETLCRIGSVSKAITCAAVCVLMERGKIQESDIALQKISSQLLTEAIKADPRYAEITVAHLLTMTAGFAKRTDAMAAGTDAARDLVKPFPIRGIDYLQWVVRKPLASAPGEQYAYDGTNQIILGRLMETVTGKTYEANVRELLMEPIGAKTFRIAEGRRKDRLPGECVYYTGFKGKSMWPEDKGCEDDYCYTLDVANAEGSGALLSNVLDLARFMDAYGNGRIIPKGLLYRRYFVKRPPASSGLAGWSVGYGSNGEVQVFNGVGAVLGGASAFAEFKGGYSIAMVTNHWPKEGVDYLAVENVVCRELGL